MKKKLLITGATSGIGFNFLKKNLSKDYEFYLIGRNFSNINKLIIKKKYKSKINKIKFDFKNDIKKINFKKIPKLDFIVLAAGVIKYNLIKDFDEKVFDEVMNVNLIQTAKFLGLLIKNNRINNNASIVVISSISGYKMAFNFHFAYSIAKAGLVAMTRSIALELSSKLIRVNTIAPGMVYTPLADKLNNDDYLANLDKNKYLLGKRYARPSEISNVIDFLLSSKSSFITGETLVIDGGFTLTK
jgi:NAD(P)-dependent dehydrogenase (short-subunit alcohol dehydrogenase family)